MKKKILAASAAAIAVLTLVAQIDETNVVSQVARKAIEFIGKGIALAFGS